jgi:HEAT repeat protein
MVNTSDPVTQWAFIILITVVMGTFLLIAVAFIRRWQQIRYLRYVHTLQREYRPLVAKLLAGQRNPAAIAALRELPMADLELLLDPLFSRRKLPARHLVFLRALCAELGLTALWQSRLANGQAGNSRFHLDEAQRDFAGRAFMRYLLRAKSIRNLGILRYRPSWGLLVNALDDRHADIQLVALRSLAAIGAPGSFEILQERLHAVVQGKSPSPPLQSLQIAMAGFDLACAPVLLPSLRHTDRQIRLQGTEILRAMVCREAGSQPRRVRKFLTPPMVELLLTGLAVDPSSEIRARAAEVIVFLDDLRATPVLGKLLLDHQWFVRLRTVRALAHCRPDLRPPHRDILACLCDAHWRVREAAIQTLTILGKEGKHQLYEHFLNSSNRTTRKQIVEVIERTGLMSAIVEEYSGGTASMDARMIEQLATDAAPMGLSGVLRTLNPEIRQKFLDRFIPYAQSRMTLPDAVGLIVENAGNHQSILETPPPLAA